MLQQVGGRSPSRAALNLLGGVAAGGLLFVFFRDIDVRRIWLLVAGIGLPSVLLLTPSFLAMALESLGFQRAFGVLGFAPRLSRLLRVRVAADSLGNVLPMGPLLVEAIKPKLLERHAGLPMATGIAGIVARKYLLVLSQAAYLAVGFFVGGAGLRAALERFGGRPELAAVPLGAAVVLAVVASVMGLALGGGTAFTRMLSALGRVPSRKFRCAVERWRCEIARTDETLSRFFRSRAIVRGEILSYYLGAWLLEATETWVMLHALGSDIGWGNATGIEALVMLARSVFVMLPGGLGAQELGYATLLAGMGFDPSASAAFALLKRARELIWVVLGFGLLAHDRSVVRRAQSSSGTALEMALPLVGAEPYRAA